MPIAWDPVDYGRHASAQTAWAAALAPMLDLTGSEAILDLGSGDGRVTAALADSVPRGHVVGLDASPTMTGHSRRHHAVTRRNLEFVLGDMQAPPFRGRFDRVFSNAALHWARDHRAVARGIARALRPGGRAVLQCGGAGNAAPMVAVLDEVTRSGAWAPFFADTSLRYTFADDASFRRILEEAGLEPLDVRLIPVTMALDGPDGLAGWIRATWLAYTGSVPVERRDAFVAALAAEYLALHPPGSDGRVQVPMVRLQAVAVRP